MCCPLDTPLTISTPINPLNQTNKTMTPNNKKSVRFNTAVWVVPMPRATEEDAQLIWYGTSELMQFRREAKEVAFSMRKGVATRSVDEYRGFEATGLDRQRQRHLSLRCIASACRKGMTPDDVAEVAEKCNEWAQKNAFVQACHDYAQVYQPHMAAMIPSLTSLPGPQYPAAWVSEKRRVSLEEGDCERRVRQRVC